MLFDVFGTQIKRHFWSLLTILLAFSFAAEARISCPMNPPEVKLLQSRRLPTLAKHPAYTQGLVFANGYLYESVGLYGKSELRRINISTSLPDIRSKLPGNVFAEGLAVLNDKIFQLTYRENKIFTYDGSTAENRKELPFVGEAWGLTVRDGMLVLSTGTNRLAFVDPQTLEYRDSLDVYLGDQPLSGLNELESAREYILANIFFGKNADDRNVNKIALINPRSGCVEKMIDVSELRTPATFHPSEHVCRANCTEADFATNGIAFDAASDELYITGKNWQHIYRFKFPVF